MQMAGAVTNDDPQLLSIAQRAAVQLYGEEGLGHLPPITVSEDFACYGEHVPSLFAFLGGGNPEVGAIYPHHNDCFRIDESVLPRGAALYAQFAVDYLKEKNGPDQCAF